MPSFSKPLLCAAWFIIAANWCYAETLILPPTDDAFINGVRPDESFGLVSDIVVHGYGPKQGLMRFDVSSIQNRVIANATLRVFLSDLREPGTIALHAVTSPWQEASVTWSGRPTTQPSSTPNAALTEADEGTQVEFDVTNLVSRWADGGLAAGGIALHTLDGIRAVFDTKEKPAGIGPILTIELAESDRQTGAIVLDFNNRDNCTITEPGYYVLDRGWYNTPPSDGGPEPVEFGCQLIVQADATIDLRGFFLHRGAYWPRFDPLILIESGNVTVRNGALFGDNVALEGAPGTVVRIDELRASGAVELADDSRVSNSRFSESAADSSSALRIGSDSKVSDSEILCHGFAPCIVGNGDNIEITGNSIDAIGWGLYVMGDDSLLHNNRIRIRRGSADMFGIEVIGSGNVVARNRITGDQASGVGIHVNGSANLLESNVLSNLATGIGFAQGGNFFGGNRASAAVGFAGIEGQTNWGGNFSY